MESKSKVIDQVLLKSSSSVSVSPAVHISVLKQDQSNLTRQIRAPLPYASFQVMIERCQELSKNVESLNEAISLYKTLISFPLDEIMSSSMSLDTDTSDTPQNETLDNFETPNQPSGSTDTHDNELKTNDRPCPEVETEEIITKIQEKAIYEVTDLYIQIGKAADIHDLLVECRSFLTRLPKAKTAKIVRATLDRVPDTPETAALQIQLCDECIAWCRQEKRTFLRHRIQVRLGKLYLLQNQPTMGLEIISALLKEVKKMDDKLLLLEAYLIESRLYFAIKNFAKAKTSLTASRRNANAIHCPPLLQSEIDMHSGILHCQDKDFQTAFSYFYEAFESFTSVAGLAAFSKNALSALKFMLLSKIMCEKPDDVNSILSDKRCLKYIHLDEIHALRMVAVSYKERSLRKFDEILNKNQDCLQSDPILLGYIQDIKKTLMETNIQRILEPYSRVEVSHIAKLIELPVSQVSRKLAEMILDGKLKGTLDQAVGVLVIFEESPSLDMYNDCLDTVKNMAGVVDVLYDKAQLAI